MGQRPWIDHCVSRPDPATIFLDSRPRVETRGQAPWTAALPAESLNDEGVGAFNGAGRLTRPRRTVTIRTDRRGSQLLQLLLKRLSAAIQ